MRIYYIDCGPIHFHGTKKEAIAAARTAAKVNDTTVTVELCVIADNRAAMINLANGITGKGEIVATVGPGYNTGSEE